MNHFKAIFFTCILSLFGFVGTFVPTAVHAQGGGSLTDCTNGCEVTTCKGNKCTVWHCDGKNGCIIVGTFVRISPDARSPIRSAYSSVTEGSQFAKICRTTRSCELYQLTTRTATLIGKYDNIEGIIEQIRARQAASS